MGIFDILKNNKKQTSKPLNTNLPNGSNGSNGSSKRSFSDIQYPLNTNLDLNSLNNDGNTYISNNPLAQNGNQQTSINDLDIQNLQSGFETNTINSNYYPKTNNYNTYNQQYPSAYQENANNQGNNLNSARYNNINNAMRQQKFNQEIDPLDLELEKYLNMSQENQNSFQSDQINGFQGIKDVDINMSENLNSTKLQNNFSNPSPTLENSRNPVDTELTDAFFSQGTENEFNNVTENPRQSNAYPETSTSEDDLDLSKLIQDLETSSITNNKTDTAMPSNMNSNQTQSMNADQNQEFEIDKYIQFENQNTQNQDIQSTQDYEDIEFNANNSSNNDDDDTNEENTTSISSNANDEE